MRARIRVAPGKFGFTGSFGSSSTQTVVKGIITKGEMNSNSPDGSRIFLNQYRTDEYWRKEQGEHITGNLVKSVVSLISSRSGA